MAVSKAQARRERALKSKRRKSRPLTTCRRIPLREMAIDDILSDALRLDPHRPIPLFERMLRAYGIDIVHVGNPLRTFSSNGEDCLMLSGLLLSYRDTGKPVRFVDSPIGIA